MTSPTIGLEFIRIDDQPQPVIGAMMDVVGIVGPCDTADEDRFPLNTPVLCYSNDTTLATDLGTDGYIADAIEAITDQLTDYQIAAQLIIVRTAYGTSGDAALKLEQTLANIMGSSIAGTGVHAFLKAPDALYCTPRLLMAPGYTGPMANSLDTLVTANDGVGYTPGQEYTITFAPGGGETHGATLVLPEAHAVADSDGYIKDEDIVIDSYGAFMTDEPTATLPAPDYEITALAAAGEMIFSRQPGIGATITLNGAVVTYIIHGGTPGATEIELGENLSETITNTVTMLNGSANAEIAKCTYAAVGGTLTITNDTPGAAGNSYTLATTVAGSTLSGSTLSGGRDAAAQVQCTLTATIALGANPVCAELPGVCDSLIAHAVVESAGTSQVADVAWRSTMNSKRLIPLSGGVKVLDPDTADIVVQPFAPFVVGAIIARDHATGYPFHSACNTAIQGIVGPSRSIGFSLTDGATEGQQLLAANLGIIARGNAGVETSISSGGFIYLGTDNCSDTSLWQMYNITRGRDYIELSLMPALRTYLGKSNIDRMTVRNILVTIQDWLDILTAKSQILGGTVAFQGGLNTAAEIRLGHLVVSFAAEEAPVLKRITTMSARWRPAIDAMVAELAGQLNITQTII